MFVHLMNFYEILQNMGSNPMAVVETNIATESQNTCEIPTLILLLTPFY